MTVRVWLWTCGLAFVASCGASSKNDPSNVGGGAGISGRGNDGGASVAGTQSVAGSEGGRAGSPGGEAGALAHGGEGGSPEGSAGSSEGGTAAAGAASAGASGARGGEGGHGPGLPRPVHLFVQFDRSGSMLDGNKWSQAARALNAFFADPESAGLRVALRFFPHDAPTPGCSGGQRGACDVAACRVPLVDYGALSVEAAPADRQEAALLAAVDAAVPLAISTPLGTGGASGNEGTPMFPALDGALSTASERRAAEPDTPSAVLLVTDGEPNGCDTRIENIAALAQRAFDEQGLRTYVIGIEGASEIQVNTIARAGGTEHAFFAASSGTVENDLIEALNAIRDSLP